MRHVFSLLSLIAVATVSTPAVAATNCHAVGNGPDIGFEFHFGEPYTEEEQTDFALMQLRQQGVDAVRVERWGGCYRAFVRDETGTHMEYFNARTLEPVGNSRGMRLDLTP